MNICLFGAGKESIDDKYIQVGYNLGKSIAAGNHTLVFGGGSAGMMGAVARGVHDSHGKIIGIMPKWMNEFEDLYLDCDEIIFTDSMADRKTEFIENSDIILVTPGGIGTLDEFFEVITLKKLKVHKKDVIIFNIDSFFDKLLDMLEDMVEKGFIDSKDKNMIIVTNTIEETISYF